MFKRILVAHDLTLEANSALRRAALLCEQFSAELIIAHMSQGDLATAQNTLEGIRAAIGQPNAQLIIRQAKASEGLLQALVDTGADLLVLGTHHKGRPEAFSGTNLERLARECQVPLLMVSQPADAVYQHAMVGLDNSLCACNALRAAHQILPEQAQITAQHIIDPSLQLPADKREEQLQIQRAVLEQLIKEELANHPGARSIELDVRHGTLAGTLDERIKALKPELLVLGQHNRSRLSEALLGSLPAYYLRQPLADVLLVK